VGDDLIGPSGDFNWVLVPQPPLVTNRYWNCLIPTNVPPGPCNVPDVMCKVAGDIDYLNDDPHWPRFRHPTKIKRIK
jgi:hypothetical protein